MLYFMCFLTLLLLKSFDRKYIRCSRLMLLRAVTIRVWNTLIMQTLTWILATDGVVTQTMTVYCAWRKVNYGFKIPWTILYTNEMHVFNFIAESFLYVKFFTWYLHYRVSHQNPQRLHHNLLLVLPMTIGNFYPKVHKIRYPNNKSITQKKERAEANPLSSYFIQCLHIP